MATKDTTGVKQFAQFSSLKKWEQQLILMRVDEVSFDECAEVLRQDFNKKHDASYLRALLSGTGRLYAAYMEINESMAQEGVRQAKLLAQKTSLTAITVLSQVAMGTVERVYKDKRTGKMKVRAQPVAVKERVAAARALANKYVPDRQIVETTDRSDLIPDDIKPKADKIFDDEQPTDPRHSEEINSGAGGEAGAGVPESLL